jgi:hypothetical protein
MAPARRFLHVIASPAEEMRFLSHLTDSRFKPILLDPFESVDTLFQPAYESVANFEWRGFCRHRQGRLNRALVRRQPQVYRAFSLSDAQIEQLLTRSRGADQSGNRWLGERP